MIKVYADGSCKPTNPGPCSCSAVLVIDDIILESRSVFLGHGTNQVAELNAISLALSILRDRDLAWESSIIITDSKYCIGVLVEEWKAQKNIDLIAKIKKSLESFPNIQMKWIKGHSGDKLNDFVDLSAKQIIDANEQ